MQALEYNRGVGVISTGSRLITLESDMTPLQEEIVAQDCCYCGPLCVTPYGLCHCGCGTPTAIPTRTDRSNGMISGKPRKFIHSHHGTGKTREAKKNKIRRQYKKIDFKATPSDKARFWAKVDKDSIAGPTGDCWLWTAARLKSGYGVFNIGPNCRSFLAHRASWLIANDCIPSDRMVCHKCDVPSCVNPDHLFLGTQFDNMRDCSEKGRTRKNGLRGEDMPANKLTTEQVLEILRTYPASGKGYAEIGKKYGVGGDAISGILRRKTWKHLGGESDVS